MTVAIPRLLLVLLLSATAATVARASEGPRRPLSSLFSCTCQSCQGPEKQKGDFRVDTLTWSVTVGAGGVLSPGDGVDGEQ